MSDAADICREEQLRAAVLAGDAAAWARWLHETFPAVAAYVRWRCGGLPDLADDALQETWLTAARRVRRFDPARSRFAAWVCGIAGNVVRNHLRARLRHHRRVRRLADSPAPSGPDGDRSERVAAALARLPERYERALRAKYLDGRPVAAIAADWGETEKAVEGVLARAREAFRDAYAADPEDLP